MLDREAERYNHETPKKVMPAQQAGLKRPKARIIIKLKYSC